MDSIFTHNGTVTVESPSGEHRTFRIKTQPEGAFAAGERILSILTGPSNTNDFTGFAFVKEGRVILWKKARDKAHFGYAKMLLHPGHYMALGVKYHFATRCRRCNRKLTTPESVESGIGPVCASFA